MWRCRCRAPSNKQITAAIITKLVAGKPLGIFAFSWAVVAAGLAREPDDVNWLAAEAISILGRGESEPLVPTADGVRESQNRRVHISF